MRLVDADALMEKLNVFNDKVHGNEHFLYGIETAKELLEDTPTVYDIEKVVEQIREFVECNAECEKKFYYGQGCSACMWGKMVDIVRKGKVE